MTLATAMAGSTRHLALLTVPGASGVTEALAAIGRLERTSPLDVLGAAVIEHPGHPPRHVALVPRPAGVQIDVAAWTWLLDGILDSPQLGGGAEGPAAEFAGGGLSESFLAEIREVATQADHMVALVVARLDPGAAVSELRGLRGARLVYGVLPRAVLDRILTRSGGGAPDTRPPEA